jgi:pSer/pThr/pTyr-binding forkhead associated (FHA) protein
VSQDGLTLTVRRGGDGGGEVPLGAVTEIGRDPAADVTLDDERVSWRHLRLHRRGLRVLVEDLGSTNGTLVNGVRLDAPREVGPGDELTIGGTTLSVGAPGRPSAPRPTPPGAPRVTLTPKARNRRGINLLLVVLILSLAVVALVVVVATRGNGKPYGKGDADAPPGTKRFEVDSRDHVVTPVSYPQTPPVGGDHHPVPQSCTFYDDPIPPEQGVHSLEHGAVWITFRPSLPSAQLDVLEELAEGDDHVLVSAFESLPTPVVASAWGRQLRLEDARDPRLESFVGAFRQGPTAPERTNPC